MPRTTAVQADFTAVRRLLIATAGVAAVVLALPSPAPAQTAAAPAQPAAAPTTAVAPAIDPQAIKALDQMGAYLRGLKVFELTANTSNDVILDDGGLPVKFDGVNTYKVRSPDSLFVDITTDRKARQFFYDGKTLTIYAPRQKFYAQVPAPGTNRELLDKLQDDYGIDMPLAELFYWGTPESGLDRLQSAQYIGPAKIGGVVTDQFAFRQPGADWQVWIARDRPLPRKLVIVHTDQDERPQYEALLDWRLQPTFTADAFKFSPPADAKPIQIVPLGAAEDEGAAP